MSEPHYEFEEYAGCAGRLRRIRIREPTRPFGPELEGQGSDDGLPSGSWDGHGSLLERYVGWGLRFKVVNAGRK